MKKLLTTWMAVLSALSVLSAANLPAWGGKYTLQYPGEDGKPYATGTLYLLPSGENAAVFSLTLLWNDGSVLVYDTDNQPIPVRDGILCYYFPDEEIDYSIEVILNPGEDQPGVFVREILRSEQAPYNTDLSPNGFWTKDQAFFPDENGYLYRIGKDGSCQLTRGGIYEGAITLPATVQGPGGKQLAVAGIETEAFMDSPLVNQVVLSNPEEQLVQPGAYNFTRIPYDWSRLQLPLYCYPSQDKMRFAVPMGADDTPPADYRQWLIFKQNVAPCRLIYDWHKDENLSCGRRDGNFDATQGVYYTPLLDKAERNKMFRGYDSYEIEALIANQEFVAFHTFPSYSRWKYPEREQNAPNAIVKQVVTQYGRQPMHSSRAAWLRDGTGELDIVEFTHQDGQATVCFVWQAKGEIYATGTFSTTLREGKEDFSVWNVDDDGTYGIPDVVSIALDPEGYVNIFLAKNSPESVTCFVLHQNGDKLEKTDLAQWYRFIE